MVRNLSILAPAGLVFAAHGAAALELDSLLPAGVPGFAAAPGVSVLTRRHPEYQSLGIQLDGLSLSPELDAATGWDSSPNGLAGGSAFATLTPSLLLEDRALGLGAYAAGTLQREFAAPSQNTAGYTLALGERAVFAQDVVTIGLAQLRASETGFALDTLSLARPQAVTATQVRLSDQRAAGMFTLTPEFDYSHAAFANLAAEDRTDYRQGLQLEASDGGPARLVAAFHATQSVYRTAAFNADSFAALAGLADNAPGLWDIRLLGGAAARAPARGPGLIAPVLEFALDWMPGDLDSLSLALDREIDDPEQESANGYTLSEARFSLAHEYLRNVVFTAAVDAAHAAYFQSPLVETIVHAQAGVAWRLNRALSLGAAYGFNDRQANLRPDAHEHVVSLTINWTP
jgi:hypothetical protein